MSDSAMLKLIHETKAVSIWNRKTGPVFWYAAGVPGPFYVNTELVIGPALSANLLEKITSIIASTTDLAERAKQLNQLILAAYEGSPQYKEVIAAMVSKAKQNFSADSYSFVSGGERRDWLFSIPFAQEIGLKHVLLFKDARIYCEASVKQGESGLHVADLINNAASYFDVWLPALQKAGLRCIGTVCVNSRGTHGVKRLEENGFKTVTLNGIDLDFFQQSMKGGLIDQSTLDEIALYFKSPQEWASTYLLKDVKLFDIKNLDKKSLERLQNFFDQDPWDLRAKNEGFFADMEKAIAEKF